MPNTITSYTTFVANTKARASQINANFSNHRGTLVPINSDTTTASTLTHDLGSSEHKWNNLYVGNIRRYQTVASTITAAASYFAVSATLTTSLITTTSTPLIGSTITISTDGRPVAIGLKSAGAAPGVISLTFQGGTTNTSYGVEANINFLRDGVTVSSFSIQKSDVSNGVAVNSILKIPPSALNDIDFVAAGTYNYSLSYNLTDITYATGVFLTKAQLYAYET